MPGADIVVIGASAGGLEALRILVSGLPKDLQAAIFVVVHVSPAGPGLLPEILARAGPLPVAYGADEQRFEPGHIYVAPLDHHMLIEAPDRIRISRGPKENGFRPAIDPLFRSAALAFSPRVAGVILSGNLDDGTVGLAAIKRRGGIAIVQDPAEAANPSMPQSALRHVRVDHCIRIDKLAALLMDLTADAIELAPQPMENGAMADELKLEVDIAALNKDSDPSKVLALGDPSLLTCPDCHGALVQLRDEGPLRFRCHTGHAFTANSLIASLSESTEDTLWSALRALHEKVMILQHMARHSRERDHPGEAAKLMREAHRIRQRAQLVRKALLGDDGAAERPAARGARR